METFTNPLMVGFYIISMVVVGSHLWHGISSAFQSLGLDQPAWTRFILPAGKIGRRAHRRRLHRHRAVGPLRGSPVMKLDARVPAGPIARSGTGTSSR